MLAQDQPVEWTPKAHDLLEAAAALFYERGIAAVGVDTVAQHAGVTKKTLYDRFGSKERLVAEYLRSREEQRRAALVAALDEARDPVERVAAVYDGTRAWAAAQPVWRGCPVVNAHAEINTAGHPAYPLVAEQKRWTRDLFSGLLVYAGVPAEHRDALATQLLALLEGAQVVVGMGADPHGFLRARDAGVALVRSVLA
ncbi:TetR/AcrR family transcriptional regulator [Nocardioides bruguierae]|uniref:TetR/AcrR family transcriptional regulator n=1 Tax=Nocardioides bruguierae TaxID=2945102 RepID=A0A9X2IG28_9ACTN|nr:TetR/AcrR family transcriptional regulator [Nocardioides bruguierae]MCM0622446.1 TetR/AcrR family transcriptional regulator [Nocardioides bruguierae]